jgi:hypothetical protein
MTRALVTAVAAAIAVLVLVGPASADVSVTVGSKDGGHPFVRWQMDDTQPASTNVWVVEVATAPTTSSDGYFYSENVAAFDIIDSRARSGEWVYNYRLDPGTYYVHLKYENVDTYNTWWGNVRLFTIAPPPPPPVVVPTRPAWDTCSNAVWTTRDYLWPGRGAKVSGRFACNRLAGEHRYKVAWRFKVEGRKVTQFVTVKLHAGHDGDVTYTKTWQHW